MKLVVRTRVLIEDCPPPVSEESTSTGHCLVRALTVRKDLSSPFLVELLGGRKTVFACLLGLFFREDGRRLHLSHRD